MHNDDAEQERQANINARRGHDLDREPDIDKVRHHLDVADTAERLLVPKKLDNFTTESPIRAFTDFQVVGKYAIGKGFRPSLAHLARYLDAMHTKEGWAFGQILLPVDDQGNPTVIFWKSTYNPVMPELRPNTMEGVDEFLREQGFSLVATPGGALRYEPERYQEIEHKPRCGYHTGSACDCQESKIEQHLRVRRAYSPDHDRFVDIPDLPFDNAPERIIAASPALGAPYEGPRIEGDPYKALADHLLGHVEALVPDDPINPKHYGDACAQIGELMTANSYQVLKYNWRLGEKDSPCIEIGKAIWYLDREITLATIDMPGSERYGVVPPFRMPHHDWIGERLKGKDQHVVNVTRSLVSWNRYGNHETLRVLRKLLQTKLDALNGCTEWGRGLEP